MKSTVLIIIIGCVSVYGKGYTQNITIEVKDAPLTDVFKKITEQTGFQFLFNKEQMDKSRPVSLNLRGASIQEVLDACFENQPFTYTILNNLVIVKQGKATKKAQHEEIDSDPFDVRGKVINEKGEPLEGVTITIKGTTTNTTTNKNGEFYLRSVDNTAVLVFTSVNLETFELNVSGKNELLVTLKTKITALKDVEVIVNTGYQEIPKERATGSFVKIDNELFNRKISTNVLDRIFEVTSGLNVDPMRIGQLGQKSPITIRGISSINANQRPLIVVDGFPINEIGDGLIQNLNPNDVENITVLKDAAAASIWGAKSGNGVIVVTTKKGKLNQKVKVEISSNVNFFLKPDLFYNNLISTSDLIDFEVQRFSEGVFNDYDDLYPSFNYFPVLSPVVEILLSERKGIITKDQANKRINELRKNDFRNEQERYLYQLGMNQQYALNISAGTSSHAYYLSLGYDKNKSSNVGRRDDRLTVRFENFIRPTNNLELNGFVVYTRNEKLDNGYNLIIPAYRYSKLADDQSNSIIFPHTYRITYIDTVKYPALLDWHSRPLDELRNGYNSYTSKLNNIRLGAGIKYKILPGLNIEAKYQYESSMNNTKVIFDQKSFTVRDLINSYMFRSNEKDTLPIPFGGIQDLTNDEQTSWNFRAQLNFARRWRVHDIATIVGVEASENEFDLNQYRRYGYDPMTHTFSTNIDYLRPYTLRGLGGGTARIPNVDAFAGGINRLRSLFVNSSYTHSNRYTLSFSARKDGANLFGVKANDKFALLWSSGFAWTMSNESFYDFSLVPFLKLRMSYGFNGNMKNDVTVFATGSYGVDFTTGATIVQLTSPPNPALRWEKVKILNMAIDFETHNHRIGGTVEYYKKEGMDLISPISMDPTSGWSSYTGNNANIKGKGIDLTLNVRNIDRGLKWHTDFLFSYNSDEVTSYEVVPRGSVLAAGVGTPFVGRPLYSIHSYRWAGLNPLNGDPMGVLSDSIAPYNVVMSSNNTKPEDLLFNGPASPQIFGSLRNTLIFKNLSFSFNLVYKFRYFFKRTSINYSDLFNASTGHSDYSKRWQKPGDEEFTSVPSLPSSPISTRDDFYRLSSILVEKGDHIRLQDIRLNYHFDNTTFKRLPFNEANIFIYVNNLGLIWRANSKGIDPDYGDVSLSPSHSFALGATVRF